MPLVSYTIAVYFWDLVLRYYIYRRIDLLVGNLKFFLLFIHTGATAFTKSYFGVGFRHQFMKVTYCSGTESSLLFCTHTQLGSDPSCNALNEVGVRCIGMFPTTSSDRMNTMPIFLNLPCRSLRCMHSW